MAICMSSGKSFLAVFLLFMIWGEEYDWLDHHTCVVEINPSFIKFSFSFCTKIVVSKVKPTNQKTWWKKLFDLLTRFPMAALFYVTHRLLMLNKRHHMRDLLHDCIRFLGFWHFTFLLCVIRSLVRLKFECLILYR